MPNIEVETSSFDIQNSVFDIIFCSLQPFLQSRVLLVVKTNKP